MASARPPNRSSDESNSGRRFVLRRSLRLRQASSRRMMPEPSMLVRETAAEQLEVRESNWGYLKPLVVLDIIWNSTLVFMAATVLVLSYPESPSTPLRLWILGYALQCILHMVCVCVEYRRRQQRLRRLNMEDEGAGNATEDSG